eukprot:TRINITY_DN4250_c0_g1_i1.p1 TRINITY_DN4250_c0_g1~~TRINITY_DN4250_c0_g1_i1.p1  ORF type:complete len:285 (+),score=63.92 TRINITY_DN4250_c0_g1_i1:260-1114(+)
MSGGIAGSISSTVVQPLDVVKTRQQQSLSNSLLIESNHKYKTLFSTFKSIFKEEGLLAFWKGTGPTLLRAAPGNALYFFALEYITITLSFLRNGKEANAKENLAIGAGARGLVTFILMPTTVVKTRFEGLGSNHYRGVWDAFKTIGSKEGARGLFSGLVPTILRDAPFSGIYYFLYQRIRKFSKDSSIPVLGNSFLAGGTAGIIATLATHPQDMIKTRLQISPVNKSKRYPTIDLCKSVYRESGILGFYKGLLPRIIRRPLVSAITWTSYEQVKLLFNRTQHYK